MNILGSGGSMKFICSFKSFIHIVILVVGTMFLIGCGDDTLGTKEGYSSFEEDDSDLESDLDSDSKNSSNSQGVRIYRVPKNKGIDFDDSLFSEKDFDSGNSGRDYYSDQEDSDIENYSEKGQDQNQNHNQGQYQDDDILDNSKIVSVNGYKCYNVDKDTCEIEYTIFKKTNEYRANRGLSELKPNMALSATARSWSSSQSRMGFISHAGFPSSRNTILRGFDSDNSLDSKNISFLSAENVAASGYSFSSNAAVGESFYTMWINSAGHRANIVGSHSYLGVGVVKVSSGMYSYYATQLFGR